MGATTRWKDTQIESFEEALKRMTSPIKDDERTGSVYRKNYTSSKISEEDSIMELNGEIIRYNIIRYGYDQVTTRENPSDDRDIRKNGYIIILEQKGAVYYIVDQNSAAKKLLRKMLSYNGRNEIEDANFDFKEDFFVWLVCQVYNSAEAIENSSGSETKELQLEEIKGIRGNTEDLQTTVTASGETVMNIISTLSFLLESRRLNQVILSLKYTGHQNICVKLQKDTVEYQSPYVGEFSDCTSAELLAKVYLLLYIEILPLLEQEYRMNRDDDVWNQDAYITFLTVIKQNIIEKIENKIKSLE